MSGVKQEECAVEMRRFKRYPGYKDSGVEWLGEIPEGWGLKPLWTNFRRCKRVGHADEELLSVYRDFGVVPTASRGDNFNRPSEDLSTYQFVEVRDLVTNKMKTWQGSIAVSSHRGIVSPAYHVYIPQHDENDRYIHYLLRSSPYVSAYMQMSKGIRVGQWDLEPEAFSRLQLLLPGPDEQRAIAAFLDRETARIDALVAKKERLIELLREQRTAVITRAVTKGLDPNVAMKDSGVEWLREIPAHWEVMRIKWAARMVSGHTPDKKVESYWQGGDIPWVSLADTGQLREVDYIASTAVMTTPDGIAHSSAHVLPPRTVVFSRDATIGLCAITRAGMAVSQHFIGWVCTSRLQPEYLLHVLRSMTQELERLTMGATVRTIGMPDVKSLVAPIPPAPEQDRIVLHVRQQRERVDSLVAKVRDAIDRLKELRTALISAAVTGKVDVREVRA